MLGEITFRHKNLATAANPAAAADAIHINTE